MLINGWSKARSSLPPDDRCICGQLQGSLPLNLLGTIMIPPLECRLRASECQKMAAQAPNVRVRDILLDMARTWTRLALEAEQAVRLRQRPSGIGESNPSRSWRMHSQ